MKNTFICRKKQAVSIRRFAYKEVGLSHAGITGQVSFMNNSAIKIKGGLIPIVGHSHLLPLTGNNIPNSLNSPFIISFMR